MPFVDSAIQAHYRSANVCVEILTALRQDATGAFSDQIKCARHLIIPDMETCLTDKHSMSCGYRRSKLPVALTGRNSHLC